MIEIINIKPVNSFRRLIVGYYFPVLFIALIQFIKPLDFELTIIIYILILVFSIIMIKEMNFRRFYVYKIFVKESTLNVFYYTWFSDNHSSIDLSNTEITLQYSKDMRNLIIGIQLKSDSVCIMQSKASLIDGSEWDEELILRVYNQLTELKETYHKDKKQ